MSISYDLCDIAADKAARSICYILELFIAYADIQICQTGQVHFHNGVSVQGRWHVEADIEV